ncbi:MAG: UvrB/UvrC motif-containing protein, partial [Alphaproteobacteria bacterium]|nr:UvrB/UvrC motif-containing protein [Alphaproteobacteria bacterium]
MNASSTNMEYEAAARYRDRIKALNTIEAKTRVNLKGEIDVDAIGMYRIDKHICIQIFFFRGGQSYGNRSYFPAHAEGYSDAEVLDAFLGLFYQNRVPPKTIWMSGDAQEHDTIQANLSEIAGYKVKITVPKRGEAAEIVGLAVSNAESSLKKKMEEENKYEDLLSKIKQTFEFKEEITRIEVYDNSHISG